MQRSVLIRIMVVALVVAAGILVGQNLQRAPEPAAPPAGTFAPATPVATAFAVSTPSPTPEPTVAPTGPGRPTVETNRVIQTAINDRTAATLKRHMAATVQYAISATECCGPMARGAALAQLLRRIADDVPFDFSPTNPNNLTVRGMATTLADYQIGYSATGNRILGYRLNGSLQLDAIYEADGREFGIAGP